MLSDEQVAMLPEYALNLCFSADIALLDDRGRSWEKGVLLLAGDLATALLARQRLERQLKQIGRITRIAHRTAVNDKHCFAIELCEALIVVLAEEVSDGESTR